MDMLWFLKVTPWLVLMTHTAAATVDVASTYRPKTKPNMNVASSVDVIASAARRQSNNLRSIG